jgi:DNA repair protein RecN (Recombination protein N)
VLQHLSIRDVLIIDRLDLDLGAGLSALTGETGAGKSILLDALGLALGGRAESGLVRPGASQASVAAEFAIGADHAVFDLLREQGIEDAQPLILRRQLSADGRSRAFINDQPVSVALLRRAGERLVEIEGQFEQQGLLDTANHRALLDAFGALRNKAEELARLWDGWRAAGEARAALETQILRARRDEEYLRHAAGELAAIDPKPGEEAELSDRRRMLMNREKLLEALNAAHGDLAGHDGAELSIRAAQRRLDRLADKAGDLTAPILAALDRAGSELAEAIAALEKLLRDPDLAPKRLEEIEERLFALRDLSRKHNVPADLLAELGAKLAAQLAALDDQSGRLTKLSQEEAAARQAYTAAAEALSRSRQKAAKNLDAAVTAELPPLKLDKARFATRFERLPESEWGANGLDRLAFEVATNPGLPPGPLAKIASGGELSRFLLALKVVLAEADPVPTLVFDEVDSGVGGATAAAVGERLARLATRLQILVVTHSPQVAARATGHWRVEKASGAKNATLTRVVELDAAGRREEIARMLSGATVTDEARAAADRLMAPSPGAAPPSPGAARPSPGRKAAR